MESTTCWHRSCDWIAGNRHSRSIGRVLSRQCQNHDCYRFHHPLASVFEATKEAVPPYSGECVCENDRLYAKVSFSDFGLFTISASILRSENEESGSDFKLDLKLMLDEIAEKPAEKSKLDWRIEEF